MKPPYYIGAVCIAIGLAACSGAQSDSIANPVPAVSAPETASTSVVGAHGATAFILVANENTGLGGSIRENPTPSPSVQQKASALQTATSCRVAMPGSKHSGWPATCRPTGPCGNELTFRAAMLSGEG